MELIWYGTASLVLREEQTSIAFDPFYWIITMTPFRRLPILWTAENL